MSTHDIKDDHPDIRLPVNMVGLKGVRIPVGRISLSRLKLLMLPVFDIFIELPEDRRGIHSSRSYEQALDMLYTFEGKEIRLEELTHFLARSLLEKHGCYKSVVKAKALACYAVQNPSGRISHESFYAHAISIASKSHTRVDVRNFIGVTVLGMVACPCALQTIKDICKRDMKNLKDLLDALPLPTHTQRCRCKLLVEVNDSFIDIIELFNIVRESMSSPIYGLLKREDEAKIILNAIKNPRFVEDVARNVITNISKLSLKDDASVIVKVQSEESIHSYDIVAYIRTKIGNVRKALEDRGYFHEETS